MKTGIVKSSKYAWVVFILLCLMQFVTDMYRKE